jgi:thymidylate synthase (FAD)
MEEEINVAVINYPFIYKELIYLAGRNCYGLEVNETNNISENELNNFIKKIIDNKHYSVLEHVNISIYISNVTRSFMAQLTRHRLCSFSIKSQHFVKHENFKYKQLKLPSDLEEDYNLLMRDIKNFYNTLIKLGFKKEIAREVLPNSCLTNIFMTTNIREYRFIIKTRITKDNVEDMQIFAKQLLRLLYSKMPELFSDIMEQWLPNEI